MSSAHTQPPGGMTGQQSAVADEVLPPARVVHGIQHFPVLDGLRGVAALLVVFFHLHLLGIGWIGVQLFFVLSGFLITRILQREKNRAPLVGYLRRFYLRRALRLFPVLYLFLFVLLGISFLSDGTAPLRERVVYAAAYLYNLWKIFTPGQLSLHDELALFVNHLWSLSVEEHFYLVWPFVVYFLSRSRLLLVCILLVCAGPLLRWGFGALWGAAYPEAITDTPKAIYLFSVSHIDAFAWGALASYWLDQRTLRISLPVWVVCLLGIYILGVLATGSLGFRSHGFPLILGYPHFMDTGSQVYWGYTAINAASFVTILAALQAQWVGRLFDHGWLRYTGRVSYGLYVYHFPLLYEYWWLRNQVSELLSGYGDGGSRVAAVLALAIYFVSLYALAALSFRFMESPILALKQRWG